MPKLLPRAVICRAPQASITTSTAVYNDKDQFLPNLNLMLPAKTFSGKTAFVTGGGTGLGKGIATTLSKLGANVFITSRKEDILKATSEEISQETGNTVLYSPADIRDTNLVEEAVQKCIAEFGLPDMIVNNAAGNFISPTERLSTNAFKSIVDIVLLGTANVTLNIGKKLIEAKKGASFLAITTHYTQFGSGYVVPSAAAKSGVETMSLSLSSEWGKYGMRFNCIAPGPIYTKGAFDRLLPTEALMKQVVERIPTGRLGTTEEIANLSSYLLSDYASWLTGEIVRLDGGELPFLAGEFNIMSQVPEKHWDKIQAAIRSKTA